MGDGVSGLNNVGDPRLSGLQVMVGAGVEVRAPPNRVQAIGLGQLPWRDAGAEHVTERSRFCIASSTTAGRPPRVGPLPRAGRFSPAVRYIPGTGPVGWRGRTAALGGIHSWCWRQEGWKDSTAPHGPSNGESEVERRCIGHSIWRCFREFQRVRTIHSPASSTIPSCPSRSATPVSFPFIRPDRFGDADDVAWQQILTRVMLRRVAE